MRELRKDAEGGEGGGGAGGVQGGRMREKER